MKKFAALLGLILFALINVQPTYAGVINVRIEGALVDFPDQTPYIDGNNRTMVPIRMIENLDANVKWDLKTQTVTISKGTDIILLRIGEEKARINDKVFVMDTKAVLTKQGRTVVPLRFISEGIGEKISWNARTQTINIGDVITTNFSYQDVFKGFFNNTDYSNPDIFLENGPQTSSNGEIKEIATSFNNLKDFSTLQEIHVWMNENLALGTGDKFARTSQNVIDSMSYTMCADRGLIFATFAREKGIPTVYVQTARIDWIDHLLKDGYEKRFIIGHIFLEMYINGNWYLVDPDLGRIYTNYDKSDLSLPRGFYAFSKSVEVFDTGILNEEENASNMMRVFSDFNLDQYISNDFRYFDLNTGLMEEQNPTTLSSFDYLKEKSAVILGDITTTGMFHSRFFPKIQCYLAGEPFIPQEKVREAPYLIELYVEGTEVPEYLFSYIPEMKNGPGIYKYSQDGQQRVVIVAKTQEEMISTIGNLPPDFMTMNIEAYADRDDISKKPLEQIVLVPANPESGFNFPYLLRLPGKSESRVRNWESRRDYLIVDMLNNGTGKSIEDCIESATRNFAGKEQMSVRRAAELEFPIMMPIIPRNSVSVKMDEFGKSYTYEHAFNRASIYIEELTTEDSNMKYNASSFDNANVDPEDYYDLDEQVCAMIEHAISYINLHNYNVEDKVILDGYSASGTFANRLACLHPDIVAMEISGATLDDMMLPISAYQNEKLFYPVGIEDYRLITGRDFDLKEHNSVARLVFMGKDDTNNTVDYTSSYFEETINQIKNLLGNEVLPRALENIQIYGDAGGKGIFMLDRGISHSSSQEMNEYILKFIIANANSDVPVYPIPAGNNLEYTVFE